MTEDLTAVPQAAKPPISQKKLEANRRNAQLSTGPRTERGKKCSRRNALKHGILASVLLVLGTEDASAYEKLLYRLRQHFNPLGEMEEYLVEKLSTCIWRERRALFWEAEGLRRQEKFDMTFGNLMGGQKSGERLCLPDRAQLDLLLRYRASISGEIRFVLNQLERLQQARKGEDVPAPIDAHLLHE